MFDSAVQYLNIGITPEVPISTIVDLMNLFLGSSISVDISIHLIDSLLTKTESDLIRRHIPVLINYSSTFDYVIFRIYIYDEEITSFNFQYDTVKYHEVSLRMMCEIVIIISELFYVIVTK